MPLTPRLTLKGALCITSAFAVAGLANSLAYAADDPRFQAPSSSETGSISSRGADIKSLPNTACTSLTNGDLCVLIQQGSSGTNYKNVRVSYSKDSGSQIHSYLGYSANGAEVTGSYFYLTSGNYRTDTWNNRYLPGCPSIVGFIYTDGQGCFPDSLCCKLLIS